jgi:hypothetical protein
MAAKPKACGGWLGVQHAGTDNELAQHVAMHQYKRTKAKTGVKQHATILSTFSC